MFNDLAIFIRVEQIRRDPLGLTIVQALVDMNKDKLAVFDGAFDLDLADRVALQKRCEELDEAFFAIPYSGGVLRVARACIFICLLYTSDAADE